MNPTLAQTTFFPLHKILYFNPTFDPPKNHTKISKIKNWMLPLKPPYDTLHFINILPSQKICTFRNMDPFLHQHPIFSALPNLNFLTSWTQKFKLHKFLPQATQPPQPKLNQNSPILILTIKLLYTYFSKTLPTGDLIWLTPIWLTFTKSSQIMQPTSNHLKIAPWSLQWFHFGCSDFGCFDFSCSDFGHFILSKFLP